MLLKIETTGNDIEEIINIGSNLWLNGHHCDITFNGFNFLMADYTIYSEIRNNYKKFIKDKEK